MVDSTDEWDGGPIDGRDQYLGNAPYWNDGGGETVDGTDPDVAGDVTAENVPEPGGEPADDTEAEVPTWPPNSDTVTEIRRRLLNGASTTEVGDWVGVSSASVYRAATRDTYSDGHIPPLRTEGSNCGAEWVIDRGGEEPAEGEVDGETSDGLLSEDTVREIRRRLLNGASVGEIADDYPRCKSVIRRYAGGARTVDPDNPPALVGDTQGNWSRVESDTGTAVAATDGREGDGAREPEQMDVTAGDARPVAQTPPEPEAPTIPTRWIVAGLVVIVGWALSRVVRGGGE